MVLKRLLPVAMLFACSSGCLSDLARNRTVPDVDQSKSPANPIANETTNAAEPNPVVVRSQSPPMPPAPSVVAASLTLPSTVPLAKSTPDEATISRTEPQVRIVATIGATPVYDQEVREAVYQRTQDLLGLSSFERKAKEKEMYNQELKRIIERELILDEMMARLKAQKRTSSIEELEKVSTKDADTRMKDIRKKLKIPNDQEFKSFLAVQGLTVEGLHRHFARGTMVNIFMSEIIKTHVKNISLADLKDYYEEHRDLFQTKDRVKWQDLFIFKDKFPNRDQAMKHCELLADRARNGEDFVKMVQVTLDHRKLPNAEGLGEERGQILPVEVEPMVFALKQGQVGIVEMDSGFHLVRIEERSYAGTRPFTDVKLQREIHRRIEAMIGEREYRKLVDSLWTFGQPKILVDVGK